MSLILFSKICLDRDEQFYFVSGNRILFSMNIVMGVSFQGRNRQQFWNILWYSKLKYSWIRMSSWLHTIFELDMGLRTSGRRGQRKDRWMCSKVCFGLICCFLLIWLLVCIIRGYGKIRKTCCLSVRLLVCVIMGYGMFGHMSERLSYSQNYLSIFYVTVQPYEDANYNF